MNDSKYIGFSSQKGGVGKSSLAEVFASITHYEKRIPVMVVDCDQTQESFYKLREREQRALNRSNELAEGLNAFYRKFEGKSYPILRVTDLNSVLPSVQEALRDPMNSSVKLVVFDFPGHVSDSSLLGLAMQMDYLICPLEADVQSLVSCFSYCTTLRDLGLQFDECRMKDILLVWNKINRSATTTEKIVSSYSDFAKNEGLHVLESRIYNSIKISKELGEGIKCVFRSTYLPPTKLLRESTGIDEWVNEVLRIIGV